MQSMELVYDPLERDENEVDGIETPMFALGLHSCELQHRPGMLTEAFSQSSSFCLHNLAMAKLTHLIL